MTARYRELVSTRRLALIAWAGWALVVGIGLAGLLVHDAAGPVTDAQLERAGKQVVAQRDRLSNAGAAGETKQAEVEQSIELDDVASHGHSGTHVASGSSSDSTNATRSSSSTRSPEIHNAESYPHATAAIDGAVAAVSGEIRNRLKPNVVRLRSVIVTSVTDRQTDLAIIVDVLIKGGPQDAVSAPPGTFSADLSRAPNMLWSEQRIFEATVESGGVVMRLVEVTAQVP